LLCAFALTVNGLIDVSLIMMLKIIMVLKYLWFT